MELNVSRHAFQKWKALERDEKKGNTKKMPKGEAKKYRIFLTP